MAVGPSQPQMTPQTAIDGDIDQEVPAIARVARVIERVEVGADGADVDELGHGRHPLDRSASAASPNRGVRPSDCHDRDKDIEAKSVAPDYSSRTAMRAGPEIRMLLEKTVSKASIAKIVGVSRTALHHFIRTRKLNAKASKGETRGHRP
jgi:hypothetical protein